VPNGSQIVLVFLWRRKELSRPIRIRASPLGKLYLAHPLASISLCLPPPGIPRFSELLELSAALRF
jgi:hypothetical protein